MATLNIKNVPAGLYRKLQARARKQRRSLSQEVLQILSETVEGKQSLSILDLEGLGKEIWEGIDPAEYVRRERDSWE